MSIKDKLVKSCDDLKAYAGKVTQNVKNDYKKSCLKNEIDEMYLTLGRIKYAEAMKNGESSKEAQTVISEITRLLSELEAFISETSDKKVCPVCGKETSDNEKYCPYCGVKKDSGDL